MHVLDPVLDLRLTWVADCLDQPELEPVKQQPGISPSAEAVVLCLDSADESPNRPEVDSG